MNFSSTNSKTQARSEKCCVLYDPSDGTIRHVHRVVTMDGADETSEDIIEKRTLKLARQFGIDVVKLHSLQVDGRSIETDKIYAVDTVNRCLVTVNERKVPASK